MPGKRKSFEYNLDERPTKRWNHTTFLNECQILIPLIEEALVLISRLPNGDSKVDFIDSWVQQCSKNLDTLNNVLRDLFRTSEKMRCLNIIQQIMSLRAHLESYLKKGTGLDQSNSISDRVRWIDCERAFQCRL